MSNPLTLGRKALFERFVTAWVDAPTYNDQSFPIEFANRRFKKPDDGPWGRLTLVLGTRSPIAIGDATQRRGRTPFTMILQVFIPEHDGSVDGYKITDEIFSASLDYATGRLADRDTNCRVVYYFDTASVTEVGKASGSEDIGAAGTEQLNATISGHFDDMPDS